MQEIVVALIGIAGIAIGSLITYLAGRSSYELELQKFRRANAFDTQLDTVLVTLLVDTKWEARSFALISRTLPGVEHDKLRQALIRVGAVSYRSALGEELWALATKPDVHAETETEQMASHPVRRAKPRRRS